MAKGERLILPDVIVAGILKKLHKETGESKPFDLKLDLEKFYDTNPEIQKLIPKFEIPSEKTIERALKKDGELAGVFIKKSKYQDSPSRWNFLNLLCYYAFKKNWHDTLNHFGVNQTDLVRITKKTQSENKITKTDIDLTARKLDLRIPTQTNPVENFKELLRSYQSYTYFFIFSIIILIGSVTTFHLYDQGTEQSPNRDTEQITYNDTSLKNDIPTIHIVLPPTEHDTIFVNQPKNKKIQ